jgi:hypothetical protein
MNLSQPDLINEKTIEFDVSIRGIGSNFYLTSYQCSFQFNPEIENGGQLSFNYVEGTSQLTNKPGFGVGISSFDNEHNITFASMAGLDTITEILTLVGKFHLQNTVPFSSNNLDLEWDFNGALSTILTGESFQNITVPANHTYSYTLDVDPQSLLFLNDFKLYQNYPNPFNPSTKIIFNLPKDGQVSLIIYNPLAQEIKVITNKHYYAGSHSIEFRGDNLPSGLYFCELKVNDMHVNTIKMVLLR